MIADITLTDLERLWLAALWLAWVTLLIGGFITGKLNAAGTHRIATWRRMGASLTLVLAAWSWWLMVNEGEIATFALLIALGMSAGFVGDLLLADLFPLGEMSVLAGMAAFGIGHVLYIVGLLDLGRTHAFDATRWLALLVWLLVAAVIWYVLVFRGQQHTAPHYAALPYGLLLASTTGLASGLVLVVPACAPIAIGAALFLFSDFVLAAQLFNGAHFRMIGDLVWLTYSPGQMLIVFGIAVGILVI